MNDFDLAVIGAGPGGLDAAWRAKECGLKTALIERKHPGGTCLNTGCIPAKTLLASSRLLTKFQNARDYGLRSEENRFDWAEMLRQKNEIVERIRKTSLTQIKKSGVEWIEGTASLAGPHTIQISAPAKRIITAGSILIATGSEPAALPGLAFDGDKIISSTDGLELPKLPASLLIVGGGAVGVEFASLFGALGIQVTLIEMMDRLLPFEDEDCAKRLENLFSRKGIKVVTGATIEQTKDLSLAYQVKLSSGEVLEVDKILAAVGRKRNTANLGLESVGIVPDKKGAIPVDSFFETKQKGIFAIGDVIDSPQLAHAASYEGTLVAENLAGQQKRVLNYAAIPSCVYADPEVAGIGLSKVKEKKARNECLEIKIPFAGIGKAQVERETDGFFKLFADTDRGIILGAAAIGAHVTELLPEIVLAIRLRLTVRDLADTCHAHPTESEIIQIVARELARKL